MKRKFTAAAAGVLAASMMFGATAFAANSPSTKTTTVTQTTSTQSAESTAAAAPVVTDYIARSLGFQNVGGYIRVESDYSDVTDSTVVATVAKADASAAVTKALDDYIALTEDASKTALGTFKVQMYKAGKSTWDGFGTFTFNITVGNKYDGQTAVIYLYHKDGTVTKTQAVVTKGKLSVSMADMGTIKILF